LRRSGILQAHERRTAVPRCPCGCGHGADRRRAARVHWQGGPWNTAVFSARTRSEIMQCTGRVP
jgi:hypothetical protein